MNFSSQVYHVMWFSGQKGRGELDHAQNQAEPENQAVLVPGPDPHQIRNFNFQKIKSATMPDHHVNG